MKIIHCADVHLDSKMLKHLTKEQAKERKNEILNTFGQMVKYASKNDVSAIIIAGDLFDTSMISVTTRNYDLVPFPLLLMLKAGRSFVPFPAYIEALFMIISFEILKESDLHNEINQ